MEGYGRSDKTRDINFDISNRVDDLVAASDYIMNTRSVKKFLVYGISSGAMRAFSRSTT
jgi:pimeloyl-ACP methyl ester carboxylesterase